MRTSANLYRRLYFAALLLVLQEPVPAQSENADLVITPDATWAVESPSHGQVFTFTSAERSFDDRERILIRPQIGDYDSLHRFIVGSDNLSLYDYWRSREEYTDTSLPSYNIYQTVPGISEDIFPDDRYDTLRSSFDRQCIDAAKELNVLIYRQPSGEDSGIETPGLSNSYDRDAVIDLIRRYDRHCLSDAFETLPARVRAAVGVLTIRDVPFCSATLIGDRTIVTARHCFLSSVDGSGHEAFDALYQSLVAFQPLEPAQNSVRRRWKLKRNTLRPPATPEAAFPVGEDIAVLDLMYPISGRGLPILRQPRDLREMEPLWVVGYNSFVNIADPVVIPPSGSPPWGQVIRFAASQTCAILRVTREGCVFHSCQSANGTSGAGLIRSTDDGFQIVAVHKGAAVVGVGCGADELLAESINVAAAATAIP